MSFYLFPSLLLNLINSKFQKLTGNYYENVDCESSKVVFRLFPPFKGKQMSAWERRLMILRKESQEI